MLSRVTDEAELQRRREEKRKELLKNIQIAAKKIETRDRLEALLMVAESLAKN